jgi:hypothetical protein
MTQPMVAGSIDIAVGAGTEMAHVAKGAPMIAICESAGPIPFIAIGKVFRPARRGPVHAGRGVGISLGRVKR